MDSTLSTEAPIDYQKNVDPLLLPEVKNHLLCLK